MEQRIETQIRLKYKILRAVFLLALIIIYAWLLVFTHRHELHVAFWLIVLSVLLAVPSLLYRLVDSIFLKVIITPDRLEAHGIQNRVFEFDNLRFAVFMTGRTGIARRRWFGGFKMNNQVERYRECRRMIYDAVSRRPHVKILGWEKVLRQLEAERE